MTSYPILTIRLIDIKVPQEVKLFSNFLNSANDLARENKILFKKAGIPVDIFHNEEVAYSGIQFSRYLGSASFTALGVQEVKALELWYELFKKNTKIPLQNTQTIKETYVPLIADKFYKYHLSQILIEKKIGDELKKLTNKLAKIERLEKYLYGNIMRLVTGHLGYEMTENDYISVRVNKIAPAGVKDTYHGGMLQAYIINFKTNIYLPQTCRLGQATALGYGLVQHE